MAGLPSHVCKRALASPGLALCKRALTGPCWWHLATLLLTSSGRGPPVYTPILVPSLTAPLQTRSLTGNFIEGCTDRHISHCHPMTSVHFWSQDQQSTVHVTGFLRTGGDRMHSGFLLASFSPPLPTHSSPSTENTGVSDSEN